MNYILPRILFFLLLLIFSLPMAWGQTGFRIRGKVVEDGKESGLPGAGVQLLRETDSTLIGGMQTGEEGRFFFRDINPGKYLVKVQYLGYQTRFLNITVSNEDLMLGPIGLKEGSSTLKEVKVEGRIPPVRQLGDTTQFNAAGYKTNQDASAEDLLTKMPGVTTSDGKVNVQGEEVKRVLVDNKPFFGEDPSTALKNIPAEMIDKIQVFDQGSDQARFTGFNDGNTTKTINIITKSGMRQGTFGRIYTGGGNDERYKAGMVLNRFDGTQRLSILGQANNINEQNFAVSDLMGAFSSGGGGRGGMGGGGGGGPQMPGQNFLVNNKKGIVNTQAAGINYTNSWGKSLELTTSYFFNRSTNTQLQDTRRTYVLARDSGQSYTENSVANNTNMNHRINARLTWTIDSNNSILYTPRATFQQFESVSDILGQNAFRESILNKTDNQTNSNQTSFSMNHEVLFRHKFAKRGRTISLNSNLGNTGTTGFVLLTADNTFFEKGNSVDSIRQKTGIDKAGWSIQNNLVYTEPLSEKSQAQATLGYNYASSSSERIARRAVGNAYTLVDTLLSNQFSTVVPAYYAGLGYNFSDKGNNLSINVNLQQSNLKNDRTFPIAGIIDRTFLNILPSLMWRINMGEKRSLRLFYRTSANAPGVDQLQDVVNNSNPLQLSTGNVQLRQDYQQNLFFRYSSTSEKNNASFFAMLGGSTTRHYIGTSTLLALQDTVVNGVSVAKGAQLTRPINLDGYISLRSFLTYSLPVPRWKINLNFNAFGTFVRTPGLLNGRENFANSPTFGGGVGISSNISKNIDFNLGYNPSYTMVRNSLNTGQNNNYLTEILTAKVNLLFWESLVFSTDLTQTAYSGLSAGFDTRFTLLGLGMGYKFLKNKQAELRATVFDLLNQNTAVSRTITETYTEDVKNNNLTRYFMLTFTYNLRAFNQPQGQKQEHQHFTPPPGMPIPFRPQ